VKWKVSRSATV